MGRGNWGRVFAMGLAAFAVSVGVEVSADASPIFPSVVADAVGVPCDPDCDLCHTTKNGGPGMRNDSEFLAAMTDPGGLQATQPQTVAPALDVVQMMAVDSNGDGIDDVTELEQGTNPVTGRQFCAVDGGMIAGPGPVEYGCFNRVAPQGPAAGGAAAGLSLLVAVAALGRRRRRLRRGE